MVVGSLNSLFGLAVIIVSMALFSMPPLAANAIGYAVGFVFSFLLHRHYTFRSSVGIYKGMVAYFVILSGAYAGNIVVLLGSTEWLGLNAYLAQVLAVGVYALLTFLGSNNFVFDRRTP